MPHDIPSHDTFSRVFSRLDPEAFQMAFVVWVSQVCSQTNGEIIAIDGKTLRRSYDKGSDKDAIYMVNAWACKTDMILGQLKTDAMGCQRRISEKILTKEADYLLALKVTRERCMRT